MTDACFRFSPPFVPPPTDPDEYEVWLSETVSLNEGAFLRKIHIDTLRAEGKRGRVKIKELSQRRRGITRREALGVK
jgi:hypothetical protein